MAAAAGVGILAASVFGAPDSQAATPGPNGQIAFESNRDGNPEIYAMNSDGSIERNLTNHPANDFYPVWSPDGSQILFGSDRAQPGNVDVWLMNADGSNPVQLTNSPGEDRGASFTSDGEKIVFHSQRNRDATHSFDLFIMNADGSDQTQIVANASAGYACGDSANGVIVFNSNGNPTGENPPTNGVRDFEVFTSDLAGGNVDQLTSNTVLDSGPKWSPDCSQISFNSQDAGGSLDVWRMDADGGDKVNLTNAPGIFDAFSSWSPDGQQIAFSTNRDVNFEIYSMASVDGSDLQRLTETKHGQGDLRGDWGNATDYDGPPNDRDQCRKDRWTEFNNPTFADQSECIEFLVDRNF